MARALSKYIQFTRMRWAEIIAHRQQCSEGKVSRNEFVYYAKTFAAEYQYLKKEGLLDHALSGSLGSKVYSRVTKKGLSEASLGIFVPVHQANEATRPEMPSEPIDKATSNQTAEEGAVSRLASPEGKDEPVQLEKDTNNIETAEADSENESNADADNEASDEEASEDTSEQSSESENALVEDKTDEDLDVIKPIMPVAPETERETQYFCEDLEQVSKAAGAAVIAGTLASHVISKEPVAEIAKAIPTVANVPMEQKPVTETIETNVEPTVPSNTTPNHVMSNNEPVVEKATTIPSVASVPMEQKSWIESIETLSHYTASLEKLGDGGAEDDLVKISSHVMHIVTPSQASSQVVSEMNDESLEELVGSIISRISSNTTNTASSSNVDDDGELEDDEDIGSIESAPEETDTSHQTHYYRPVTPPSTNVSDSDSDTEENKGLIARVSSMFIGRKQSKSSFSSSVGTLKDEVLNDEKKSSTFVSRMSAMVLKPSDMDPRMNKSKTNMILDGIGEGDSQSMGGTTVSSSFLSSVFSGESDLTGELTDDAELYAIASGELAHVEEMIPEHHKPSTLTKRSVFRRATHKIKDGTYECACEFNFIVGTFLGSLITIGVQFAFKHVKNSYKSRP